MKIQQHQIKEEKYELQYEKIQQIVFQHMI